LNGKSALSKGAIQHANLVAQSEIFQSEFALRFQERPDGRKQAPEHVEHDQAT
jgi:hypothetical protein